MNFTDAQIAELLAQVFAGTVTGFDPSLDLYIATAEHLDDGLFEGYGMSLFDEKGLADLSKLDAEMLGDLRDNIHVFSAFKSHHSADFMGSLIWDDDGIKRSFSDFKLDAMNYFGITHDTHLETEFRTSIAMGRGASFWRDIQDDKDQFQFLTYNTVGDERVRPDHEDFDGITRRVNDKFWKTHFPPNGFRCRCDVDQESGTAIGFKQTSNKYMKSVVDPPELFKMNPALDRVVFAADHPAFTVADKYKVEAKNMFGLPPKFGRHLDE
jgi:SPP1 gp7 family putative phage head morphogenesis protein